MNLYSCMGCDSEVILETIKGEFKAVGVDIIMDNHNLVA